MIELLADTPNKILASLIGNISSARAPRVPADAMHSEAATTTRTATSVEASTEGKRAIMAANVRSRRVEAAKDSRRMAPAVAGTGRPFEKKIILRLSRLRPALWA